MKNPSMRTMWLGVVVGLLVVTAPNWINKEPVHTYDAPWVYPTR